MHIHQPKHTPLKSEEVKKILEEFNVSLSQLPKVKHTDPALPENCTPGTVVKIERKDEDIVHMYYRVVA